MLKRLVVLISAVILPAAVAVAPAQARWSSYPHGRVLRMRGWSSSILDPRSSLSVTFALPSHSIEPGAPPSAPVGINPSGFAVNEATHTVYVVNDGDNTVSVIDADACNAARPEGCGHPLATISLGPSEPGAGSAILTPDGGTLYVDSPGGANSVAVIDAATCNAVRRSGCGAGPVATVATGNAPIGMVEDVPSQTLYVANLNDNTVSVIDASQCNAQRPAGCAETSYSS